MSIVPTNTIRASISNVTNQLMDQKTQLANLFIDVTVALSNARNANNQLQLRQDLSVLSSDSVSVAKDIARQRNALSKLHVMNEDCMEMSEEDYNMVFDDFKSQLFERDVLLDQLHNRFNAANAASTANVV